MNKTPLMYFDDYTAEDLALYKEFRNWVLHPTRESNIFWSEWLERHPEKLPVVELARQIVENTPLRVNRLSASEFDEIASAIELAIDSADGETEKDIIPLNSYAVTQGITEKAGPDQRRKWLYYAAAIAVLLASIFFFDQDYDPSIRDTDQYITTESPLGQISLIHLPDGTRIWLNAGSSIRYLEHFTGPNRNIYLEGEAYFEVAKDSLRPFTVFAGDIATTALGTSFNIKNFEENASTNVALLTGKVVVKDISKTNQTNPDFILTPGEMAQFNLSTRNLSKTNFELESATYWKEGIIYFENASFQVIENTLERMFNVEIQTHNISRHTWSYNGHFDNENLELVLKKIALTEDFEYTISKNKVEITFNR